MSSCGSASSGCHQGLPSPFGQRWVHAVDNIRAWRSALEDDSITSIETDLVMGYQYHEYHRPTDSELTDTTTSTSGENQTELFMVPIMAHPPSTTSDLSMEMAFDLLKEWLVLEIKTKLSTKPKARTKPTERTLTATKVKIIKLDFKDRQTIRPTLQRILDIIQEQEQVLRQEKSQMESIHCDDDDDDEEEDNKGNNDDSSDVPILELFFILNADILCGPGQRDPFCLSIDAEYFMETCLWEIQRMRKLMHEAEPESSTNKSTNSDRNDAITSRKRRILKIDFGLSIGYKTDFSHPTDTKYTPYDHQSIVHLIKYWENKFSTVPHAMPMNIILALNARILSRRVDVFNDFLNCDLDEGRAHKQLLIWTGKGEPPIPRTALAEIQAWYECHRLLDFVGFDCQVEEIDDGENGHQKVEGPEVATSSSGIFSHLLQNKRRKTTTAATVIKDSDDFERHRLVEALEDAVCLRHYYPDVDTASDDGKEKKYGAEQIFFLPHNNSIGTGKFNLSKDEYNWMKELSYAIVNSIRSDGATWGDDKNASVNDDDVKNNNSNNDLNKIADPRRRMYGFLNRQALIDSGIKISTVGAADSECDGEDTEKEHDDTMRYASVDLKLINVPPSSLSSDSTNEERKVSASSEVISIDLSNLPSIILSLMAITQKVHSLVPLRYKKYVSMNQLIAVQPNLHNGATYLPAHLDFPRRDGFGVVIVTLAIRANGKIILIDEGDDEDSNTKSYTFDVYEGQSYVLCGDARNKCVHGVLCDDGVFCSRETLNLRYGLHTKEFAYEEIDRHWK